MKTLLSEKFIINFENVDYVSVDGRAIIFNFNNDSSVIKLPIHAGCKMSTHTILERMLHMLRQYDVVRFEDVTNSNKREDL